MRSILEQGLTQSGVSFSNIALSGTSTFDFEDPNSVAANYSGLDIAVTIDDGGIVLTTTVDGEFKASVFMQDAGQFCLNIESGIGEASVDAGVGEPILVVSLTEGFVPLGMVINYTCNANALTMVGWNIGTQQWVYGYSR